MTDTKKSSQHKEEDTVEPSTKPEFNITSIDAVVDANSISKFMEFVGLDCKVKIHIEKI